MILRNKKTGQEGNFIINKDHFECVDLDYVPEYRNPADLNEEWEYYEEPKEHWAIDQFGEPINVTGLSRLQLEKLHRCGNDFPSKNATIEAVEKLKALKRLKDKGFKFEGWTIDDGLKVSICTTLNGKEVYNDNGKEIRNELDLIFGGNE